MFSSIYMNDFLFPNHKSMCMHFQRQCEKSSTFKGLILPTLNSIIFNVFQYLHELFYFQYLSEWIS